MQGVSDDEIKQRVVDQKLFQYPSPTNLRRIAQVCLVRLDAFEVGVPNVAQRLTNIVANGMAEESAQANMYAMMLLYPLLQKFMLEEIAERLRQGAASYTRADLNAFFTRIQVEDANAVWAESTEKRIKSTLVNCLVQTGYLSSRTSTQLQNPLLNSQVKACIEANGHAQLLPAFGEWEVR